MNCAYCGECNLVGELIFSQEVQYIHISMYLKFQGKWSVGCIIPSSFQRHPPRGIQRSYSLINVVSVV